MSFYASNILQFQWVANPVTDMYADAVMTVILRAETDPMPKKSKSPFTLHFASKNQIHDEPHLLRNKWVENTLYS